MLQNFLTLFIMLIINNDNLTYLLTNFSSTDKNKIFEAINRPLKDITYLHGTECFINILVIIFTCTTLNFGSDSHLVCLHPLDRVI